MGKNQSKEVKEEIIIAQAGNSGGSTTTQSQSNGVSRWEVAALLIATIIVLGVLFYCYRKVKKNLEKKIRTEIRRSQEFV